MNRFGQPEFILHPMFAVRVKLPAARVRIDPYDWLHHIQRNSMRLAGQIHQHTAAEQRVISDFRFPTVSLDTSNQVLNLLCQWQRLPGFFFDICVVYRRKKKTKKHSCVV